MQSVEAIWAQSKHSSAFRAIVSQEFERALQDLSVDVMQEEAQVQATFQRLRALYYTSDA